LGHGLESRLQPASRSIKLGAGALKFVLVPPRRLFKPKDRGRRTTTRHEQSSAPSPPHQFTDSTPYTVGLSRGGSCNGPTRISFCGWSVRRTISTLVSACC